MAVIAAAVFVLSMIGLATLVSAAFGRHNVIDVAAWMRFGVPAVFIVAVIVPLVFGLMMRRVGVPFGDVVGAAHRVADGDYSVRVTETGPVFLRAIARAFNSMTSRLEAQDRLRRDLMADIAHELRTPLSVIQGRVEALLDGVYPRDDHQLAEVLQDTRVLARLVEDLRTLANAESGALRLQKEPTDIALLLHEAARSLAAEADAAGIQLHVTTADDLPTLDVDPLRVREVVVNLIANAIRHSTAASAVEVRAEPFNRGVRIVVSDTGPGIPADELARIFDRFHRGAASHGSGLGLTIARNLVQAHGGEITASSEVGRGTTMTVTLPEMVQD
jgi:two-component system OmpR family sensor kinase/two-component system sensor histidine kinase BaeS